MRVTILILIDGFLQYVLGDNIGLFKKGHNPYFNRWFSAIKWIKKEKRRFTPVTILILIDGFLQYGIELFCPEYDIVTILILIDGFLQCTYKE